MVVAVVARRALHLQRVAGGGLHGERVELVHRGAVALLHAEQLTQQIPALAGHVRQDTHHVLRAVAEADAARAQPQLVERQVARPVFGGVALARVVDVEHGVQRRVRRLDLKVRQILVPVGAQRVERRRRRGGVPVAADIGQRGLDALRLPQLHHQPRRLAGGERTQMAQQRADVVAALRLVTAQLRLEEAQRAGPGAVLVRAEEAPPVGLERRGGQAGRQEVDARVAVHERVLHQDGVAFDVVGAALHRLRDPVGVGELVERSGWVYSTSGMASSTHGPLLMLVRVMSHSRRVSPAGTKIVASVRMA